MSRVTWLPSTSPGLARDCCRCCCDSVKFMLTEVSTLVNLGRTEAGAKSASAALCLFLVLRVALSLLALGTPGCVVAQSERSS